MPKRDLKISVSEPTMRGGVWTLAQFQWRALSSFSHEEIEDSVWSRSTTLESERLGMGLQFEEWLRTMPAVERYYRRLDFNDRHDFATDVFHLSGVARGWFALSDDEAKTARMLAAVNVVEGIPGMTQMLFAPGYAERVERFAQGGVWFGGEAERESLLRPGTANNDINPDFTTGRLHYRERYDAGWIDWRNVYGTFSNDSVDATRYALTALTEISGNPVDGTLPAESSEGTLPSDASTSDGQAHE